MSNRKAKAPRKLSPWEQIEQNSARMCKKAVHKAKCSNGQRALKIKPTVTGIVFVPRAGSQ